MDQKPALHQQPTPQNHPPPLAATTSASSPLPPPTTTSPFPNPNPTQSPNPPTATPPQSQQSTTVAPLTGTPFNTRPCKQEPHSQFTLPSPPIPTSSDSTLSPVSAPLTRTPFNTRPWKQEPRSQFTLPSLPIPTSSDSTLSPVSAPPPLNCEISIGEPAQIPSTPLPSPFSSLTPPTYSQQSQMQGMEITGPLGSASSTRPSISPSPSPQMDAPHDASIITQQHSHRSVNVAEGDLDGVIQVKRTTNPIFWNFEEKGKRLHKRVLVILRRWGLYGVARCRPFSKIDNHLITALVERWRRETHTFHFSFGEATVTLQDVAIIWGLPIEGNPMIDDDVWYNQDEWIDYIWHQLGIKVDYDTEMKSTTRILLSTLSFHLTNNPVTDYTPEAEVEQYTRGVALLLFGTTMMPDTSNNSVSILYLLHLQDEERASNTSWGSAVLACLYRSLCNAVTRDRKTISGPMDLLIVWAWSRISSVRPQLGNPLPDLRPVYVDENITLPVPPYAARWIATYRHTKITRNSLRVVRESLDRLHELEWTWEPYDMHAPDILALDERCISENWLSQCPLIFWSVVEIHFPDRVTRQFGIRQKIPSAITFNLEALHYTSRANQHYINWTTIHASYITLWNSRADSRIQGTRVLTGAGSENGYRAWYRQNTRQFITPLQRLGGGGFQPSDVSIYDVMGQWCHRLTHVLREVRDDDFDSYLRMHDVVRSVVDEMGRRLQIRSEHVDHDLHSPPHCVSTSGRARLRSTTAGPSSRHRAV